MSARHQKVAWENWVEPREGSPSSHGTRGFLHFHTNRRDAEVIDLWRQGVTLSTDFRIGEARIVYGADARALVPVEDKSWQNMIWKF